MLKKIGKIALLVLIFVGGFAAGLVMKYYIDDWRAKRNVAIWMESFEAPYKNDKYGGKTPEETFDLYLAALKKGDLELASRYYKVEKRERKLELLKEIQKRNQLSSYVNELESIKKETWKKEDSNGLLNIVYEGYRAENRIIQIVNKKGQVVEEELPIGKFESTMIFERNNNIWKIYSL